MPSDPSLVHHVILYQDPSGTSATLDQNDPTPGYVCFGGIGSNEASMIAGWAPGAGPVKMPPGFGVKLDPQSKLVIQVHYPSGNAGKVDDTEINLKFVEKGVPSREIFIAPILNHFTSMLNGPLTIKAGQRKTFKQLFINPFQLTVTGIAPHAHLVCESMKAFGVTPGGDTLEFINIPHWDFEWQGYYQFQKPIIVPPGTAIYGEASYNNTSVNHHLPFDQPRDVHVGEATTDEMMVFFFGASDYVSGDEDLYFDTTDLRTTIASCQESIVTDSPNFTPGKFSVHPNPSSGHFQIKGGPVLRGARLQLHSLEGQVVYEKVLTGSTIEVGDLQGVYVARVVGHDGTYYPPFKLVLQ